jgi:hypothetical protein
VQGGLTTTIELTINRRPFIYFPLKNHCERVYHMAYRLDRYRAGRRLDYASTSVDALAEATLATLGADMSTYRREDSGAAGRAAAQIAELLQIQSSSLCFEGVVTHNVTFAACRVILRIASYARSSTCSNRAIRAVASSACPRGSICICKSTVRSAVRTSSGTLRSTTHGGIGLGPNVAITRMYVAISGWCCSSVSNTVLSIAVASITPARSNWSDA